MLSLPDRASVERAIASAEDGLAAVLTARLETTLKNGVADMTHYLVIQADDHDHAVVDVAGFDPLVNPINKSRFPDPDFHPWWDWLDDVGSWFEMIVTIGDGGFAFVILIEKHSGVECSLISLCKAYTR